MTTDTISTAAAPHGGVSADKWYTDADAGFLCGKLIHFPELPHLFWQRELNAAFAKGKQIGAGERQMESAHSAECAGHPLMKEVERLRAENVGLFNRICNLHDALQPFAESYKQSQHGTCFTIPSNVEILRRAWECYSNTLEQPLPKPPLACDGRWNGRG